MSDKSSQNDPSMNEILGSIRRIISEDNSQTADAAAAPGSEGEILELTEEMVAADDDAAKLEPTLGSATGDVPEPAVRREPILGLHSPEPPVTEAVAEKPAATAEQPMMADQEVPAPAEQDIAAGVDERAPTPESAQDAQPRVDATPVTEPEPAALPDPVGFGDSVREIVSESATASTANALGELTRAMDEKTNKLKVGPDDLSVSDMVKELIRPMLREWLDENLPGIVDRIVRREIQKLVDRAETDD